jgi:hypothetical protein
MGQPAAALAIELLKLMLLAGTSTGSVTAGTVTGAVGTLIYSWKNASNTEVELRLLSLPCWDLYGNSY